MFIVDAHLDLAYNHIRHRRDLLQPVAAIRRAEARGPWPNGVATVSFPALLETGVGLVFGTIFVEPAQSKLARPDNPLLYKTAAEAHRLGQEQLDYYHRLADEVDYIRLVGDQAGLNEVVASHREGGERLVGIVPLMEGADPVQEPEELELWYERGLRIIGLAWDDTRYAAGAWREGGPLTDAGRRLLEVMASFGFILDLTHMSEKASLEALDRYEGRVIATHSNCRALVPGQRQLGDTQIRRLIERDGIIGTVLANAFLKAGHPRSGPKAAVTLEHVVAHIDHVCQLAGSARHVAIGSDLDGGFGAEKIPAEMDNVADLPKIGEALKARGYAPEDIATIMGGNWLRLLRESWQ